jgi:hypothetical protein
LNTTGSLQAEVTAHNKHKSPKFRTSNCKPACPKPHPSTYYNISPYLFTTNSGIIEPAVYFPFQFLSQQNPPAHTRRFATLAPILRHRRSELLVWIQSQILVTVLDTFPILSNILVEIPERPIVNGDLNLTQVHAPSERRRPLLHSPYFLPPPVSNRNELKEEQEKTGQARRKQF